MEQVEIKKLKELIDKAKKIVFLTGAGASTESNIPDFRGSGGLWKNNQSFASLISKSYFNRNPKDFWKSYKEIFSIKLLQQYEPNSGHYFITQLQNSGKDITVITQNIDGLHTKAGTKDVFEVHGTLQTATCPKCKTVYDIDYIRENEIPRCNKVNAKESKCEFILKPDVVLYGDQIKSFNQALGAAYDSDLFIVMGSSLEVGPINTIPKYIGDTNIPTVLINKEKTDLDDYFDLCIYDKIGNVVKELKK
ncbi:NAD-dependent protein deacylase [Bacillus mexicanus]|uniref:NAD-dependent protein deacylase n=1 Tax=Bacillus mexicanus TaxID=2834415 RepID=UPI003D1CBB71